MPRLFQNRLLDRTLTYWRNVRTCGHGDWCGTCHWISQDPIDVETKRPCFRTEEGKKVFVHEEIYTQCFPGGLYEKDEVVLLLNECGMSVCVNPRHHYRELECFIFGNTPKRPSNDGHTYISPDIIRAIRKERDAGVFIHDIADKYGISIGSVSTITRNLARKDVD
jgi:hypothetical protein